MPNSPSETLARQMPKVLLHEHLDGGLRPATVVDIAGQVGYNELPTTDPDELINVVKTLEPTFGGINLEDIKAPECFYIEQKLKEIMNIPVFHDDQHGTAVISGAGLINAAHIAGRTMEDMKVVVVGAGAAGIACANFYVSLGVKRGNIWMFDSKGSIAG